MRISIAMATCNGARFLREQLDSLAAQTLLPLELHIGDDGSTDATLAIAEAFAAAAPFPVHLHRNARPLGYGENFIRTALRCSGEWVAFCDQDDIWLPDKLDWCAARIAAGGERLALIAHNATATDEALRPSGLLYRYPRLAVAEPLELPPEWYCAGLTQVFRARLLRDIPSAKRVSFPWHPHRNAHDVWVALLANATGEILRSAAPLVLYRRHAGTVTASGIPESMRDRLHNNGRGFAQRAAYLTEVAGVLRDCAPEASQAYRGALREASARIDAQARVLQLRSQAYEGRAIGERARALGRLLGRGAYLGKSPWRFGALRLAKDSLAAMRLL